MRIGIDLGGTKIEAIAIDGGNELLRRRMSAPRGDYEATVAAVRDLVAAIERDLGGTGTVGIGIPGAISAVTGLVKNANSTWLIGRPLDRDLERALGRPVRVMNDANCFALSEATDGAAQGARTVFGVILGTGTGGGIVVNGRVLEGRHRIAGEWGHNPLPWMENSERPGPPCYCGRVGCIETFLSGAGLSATYASIAGRPRRSGRNRDACRIGRCECGLGARHLRNPAGARAGKHRQCLRSGRHRPWWRLVEHRPAVQPGAAAAEAFRFFRFSRYTTYGGSARRFQRRTGAAWLWP